MPTLALVDSDAMNCCLVVGPEQATLAITRGLAEQMGRMELEAVLARELALLRDGEAEVGTVLAGFASLLPGSLSDRVTARMGDPARVVVADLTGARLTRYPPGLVSALTILSTARTAVPGAKRCSAHLWLAQPFGSGTPETDVTHPPIETRIDTLREL